MTVYLYGSYASYVTAKTRSYLLKKGVPFVERVPGHPRFREHVRANTLNHRIPQLELSDGSAIQDSVAIMDRLEEIYPEPSVYPPGLKQQTLARLFEVLVDGLLGRPAWHYRWNYMEENYGFVGREFGRSFKPQGTNEEIDHFGEIIAQRMESKRSGMGASEEALPVFESFYLDALEVLENHFVTTPYLFGGMPSVADFALMGPLFGHLARDPEPARIMKQLAPRVFRWTEAMNTPHIQSPEFADFEMAFDSGDQISEGALNLFRLCLEAAGQLIPRTAEIYNEWVMDKLNEPDNTMISKEVDEPSIGRFETVLRGVTIQNSASLYSLWVHQRTLEWFGSKEDDERETISEFLSEFGAEKMLAMKLKRALTRVNNHIALGPIN
ncbi:MAG: hypothetical protein CMP88_04175 [Gammaproteobacteria bacterium]|jgi:glutathione S-transferase|nr:hypothetical protein [Gammaproteobacteria bacterium]